MIKFISPILAALGGAALTIGTQTYLENRKVERSESLRIANLELSKSQEKVEAIDTLFDEYNSLGLKTRNVGLYLNGSREGNTDEVWEVADHFRKVISMLVNERVEAKDVANYYGGRLTFWGTQFVALGEKKAHRSDDFSDDDRRFLGVIGASLIEISGEKKYANSDTDDAHDIPHYSVAAQPVTVQRPSASIAEPEVIVAASRDQTREPDAETNDVEDAADIPAPPPPFGTPLPNSD